MIQIKAAMRLKATQEVDAVSSPKKAREYFKSRGMHNSAPATDSAKSAKEGFKYEAPKKTPGGKPRGK